MKLYTLLKVVHFKT